MDGVLVDAAESHFQALEDALAAFGFGIGRDRHTIQLNGLTTRTKLDMLTRDLGLPRELHAPIHAMKQARTAELLRLVARPIPQHHDLLVRLRALGYRTAVASNSIRNTVSFVLDATQLAPMMDVVLSNEDVARPKPAPDIYLAAASQLGVAPEACLVIEDHPYGVAAAQAAGAQVLRVNSIYDVSWETVAPMLGADPRPRLATAPT
jgi:HAD superfamily hydrolase (TIGR01509 family)